LGKPARIINQSTNMVGTINEWSWVLDGNLVASNQQPVLIASVPGTHTVKLVVKTNVGCESDTVTKTFMVNPAPVVSITAQDGCLNVPVNFFGTQTDNITTITQWNWNFGDGATSTLQDPVHDFSVAGNMNVQLNATASNGCVSSVVTKMINVGSVHAIASNDTIILKDIPFLIACKL